MHCKSVSPILTLMYESNPMVPMGAMGTLGFDSCTQQLSTSPRKHYDINWEVNSFA